MQFALILEALSALPVVLAIVAGGKVRAVVAFATWATRRVGRFFDDARGKQ